MSNFQESGINFKFQSPQWTVVKYDEHLAHKKVSNALQPTKAVDFLGIHDNGQLFLIEVKNYREHTHDEETRNVLQAKGDELMRRIAVKVRDTIATVTGSARFSTNDEAFFTQVNQLLVDDRKKIYLKCRGHGNPMHFRYNFLVISLESSRRVHEEFTSSLFGN